MSRICEGRVVAISGAGRGIGREYTLEFARLGAKVIANDLGSAKDGTGGATAAPAEEVVQEIRSLGGDAIADNSDVASFDGAERFVASAVEHFGQLDVLVNNAGILRDRTLVNMTIDEWDAVIRVHLRGTFGPSHWAANHWRDRAKKSGPVNARLINTTSSSGLFANIGQGNHAAAKAGIASFTIVASRELARYGVTANAIYPTALSRLTQDHFGHSDSTVDLADSSHFNPLDPSNIAPVVAWLGSSESADVTGRVFGVRGGRIVVATGWSAGPTVDNEGRWNPNDVGAAIRSLVSEAPDNAEMNGLIPSQVD